MTAASLRNLQLTKQRTNTR